MSSAIRSVESATGNKRQEDKNCEDHCNEQFPMSWTTRLIGFAITTGFGFLISFISWFTIGDCYLRGNCARFGILFTMGNIIGVAGSMFLSGPCTQFFAMFNRIRVVATCLFLSTIVGTIIVCAIPDMESGARAGLIILLCIAQYASAIWYNLTYLKLPGVDYTAADFVTEKLCCGFKASIPRMSAQE